jgi:hypothetical protein
LTPEAFLIDTGSFRQLTPETPRATGLRGHARGAADPASRPASRTSPCPRQTYTEFCVLVGRTVTNRSFPLQTRYTFAREPRGDQDQPKLGGIGHDRGKKARNRLRNFRDHEMVSRSVAGRTGGLPAPVSVRHGKPKDRRRPRLPADGSGNLCCAARIWRQHCPFGPVLRLVARGIAAPGDVGESLAPCPAGMSRPRRNCVAGLRVVAGHATACTNPGRRKRTSGANSPAAVSRQACGGAGLTVRCRKPH